MASLITTAKPSASGGNNPVWGDDKPLCVTEAAAAAEMPISSFNRLIYSRQIASVKKGKRRMVRPSAIRAYFEKQTLTAI